MSENNLAASPTIFGLKTTALTDQEGAFFHEARPWGVIIFARNIETMAQLRQLTDSLRAQSGNPHLPIMIDQEGGRVARLRPPLVQAYPAADAYRQLYAQNPEKGCEAARLGGFLLAADLHDAGINVNCAPCLDLGLAGMSEVIGDRAFGDQVTTITDLAAAFIDGQEQAGVMSVVKHLPGHGRATVDSHIELPLVDTPLEVLMASDFEVFKRLNQAPLGMTGHLKFEAIDSAHVSTFSPSVMNVIRQQIGFEQTIMSDDVSMQALDGDFASRAQRALTAGCDLVLHCNGDMQEMQAVMAGVAAYEAGEAGQVGQTMSKPRLGRTQAQLATRPSTLDQAMRDHAQQAWGELIGEIFPDALNAV